MGLFASHDGEMFERGKGAFRYGVGERIFGFDDLAAAVEDIVGVRSAEEADVSGDGGVWVGWHVSIYIFTRPRNNHANAYLDSVGLL